jgi:general secretion pathway protein F
MTRLFKVRRLQAPGNAVVEEVLPAMSADELRARLAATGTVVLAISAATPTWTAWATRGQAVQVAWWCRELETLLRAGMSPVEAIETLATGRAEGGERARVHAQLLQALRQGAALSRAMRMTGVFPEVLLAGVTASERTSTLAGALADFLRYDELLQRLRRQVVSAALYPALVIGLGGAIAAFLLLYVIPRFSRMYGSFHGTLSGPTEFVLGLSRVLREHGWLIALLMAAAVAGLALAWRTGAALRALAQAAQAIAPLRRQLDHYRLAQLYQALALLVRGGYTVDEALQVAAGMALGEDMAARVRQARGQVALGKPVSAALGAAQLTDPITLRLLAVGERSGGFAQILQTIAERHSAAFTTFVERATRLLEPVLLLAVALVVGGLVVMMYMPIFDIAGGLGNPR